MVQVPHKPRLPAMPASGSAGKDGSAVGLEVDVVDPTRAVSRSTRVPSIHVYAILQLHCVCHVKPWSCSVHPRKPQNCTAIACRHGCIWCREVSHLDFAILSWGSQSGERVLGRARQGGGPRRASDSDSDGSADGSADDAGPGAAARAASAPQVC